MRPGWGCCSLPNLFSLSPWREEGLLPQDTRGRHSSSSRQAGGIEGVMVPGDHRLGSCLESWKELESLDKIIMDTDKKKAMLTLILINEYITPD